MSVVWGSGFHWVGIRSAVWASAERPPLEGWSGARTQPDGRSGLGHRERGRGTDLAQDGRTQQFFEDGETRSHSFNWKNIWRVGLLSFYVVVTMHLTLNSKILLSSCCVPVTVLGARDTVTPE